MPAQQQKQHGFFHSGKPAQQDLKPFSEGIGNLDRRLRLLEESTTNIRKALQLTEQNMIAKNKVFATEIKTLTSELSDIKKEISEIKEKVISLIKELQDAAKKDEVKILERYINFWNPVKFVTQNEVEEIVKDLIKKNLEDNAKAQNQ